METAFSSYYRKVNEDDEKGVHREADALNRRSSASTSISMVAVIFRRVHITARATRTGMGLCLYLALMNHLPGANFTFAVLDDVLMSVDASHRRQSLYTP